MCVKSRVYFQYRQPLKTTENTEPLVRGGSGKRRKVTKRSSPTRATKTIKETTKSNGGTVGRRTNGGAAVELSPNLTAELKITR